MKFLRKWALISVHATVVVESALAPPLVQALFDLSGAASTCFQFFDGSFKMLTSASLDTAEAKVGVVALAK